MRCQPVFLALLLAATSRADATDLDNKLDLIKQVYGLRPTTCEVTVPALAMNAAAAAETPIRLLPS